LAQKEYDEARKRYGALSPNTADRFKSAVDQAVERIKQGPSALPRMSGEYRWIRVQRFPYILVYRSRSEDDIVVAATAHTVAGRAIGGDGLESRLCQHNTTIISQFHLKHFAGPDSLSTKDPWVWQGFIPDGPIKRCAPKKVGRRPLMFDGPGGLADRETTIESFLANEVESPAADAMREVCARTPGGGGDIPPALSRYLAWAAARSLPMQKLENFWLESGFGRDGCIVEPPPDGLLNVTDRHRDIQMRHATLGSRLFPAGSDLSDAIAEDGIPTSLIGQTFSNSFTFRPIIFRPAFSRVSNGSPYMRPRVSSLSLPTERSDGLHRDTATRRQVSCVIRRPAS
jgi:ParE toxin of type II toxin-antitoxin system, parDE